LSPVASLMTSIRKHRTIVAVSGEINMAKQVNRLGLAFFVAALSVLLGAQAVRAADDLAELSDEFNDPRTASQWEHVYKVEGSTANQLQTFDISRQHKGELLMVPHASVWYQDYRGVLAFKPVTGDFVVTTRLRTAGRNGDGAPRSSFSLAGLMLRTPREVTPQTWKPGGENYVFLSAGSADQPGQYQLEVKTTINSRSDLIVEKGEAVVTLRAVRVGPHIVLLRKFEGGSWVVHRRYHRDDIPQTLQVGLTCYTDWNTCKDIPPAKHNQTVIRGGSPDLTARFDYARYARPVLPDSLKGAALSNADRVDDATILATFGGAMDK
jgi:hypothetical protein